MQQGALSGEVSSSEKAVSEMTLKLDQLPIPPPEMKKINPFMLNANALLSQGLKTAQKCDFVEENLALSDLRWKKNVTERMRSLDDLRMRTPTDNECSQLNIPNDRLNMDCVQSLLLLCGGCVGVRFSSEELQQLVSLASSCDALYKKVDAAFKSLSKLEKAKRLLKSYEILQSEKNFQEENVEVSAESSSSSVSVDQSLHNETEIKIPKAVFCLEDDNIISMHHLIESYYELLFLVQIKVKLKNKLLPSAAMRSEKGL